MTASTRLKVGLSFAIGGNLLFFSFWWLWMPWSASFKATLTAILFFAPETGTLICVAIIGRDAYEYFKNTLLKRWRKWRRKPEPEPEAHPAAVPGMDATAHPLAARPGGEGMNAQVPPSSGAGSPDIH